MTTSHHLKKGSYLASLSFDFILGIEKQLDTARTHHVEGIKSSLKAYNLEQYFVPTYGQTGSEHFIGELEYALAKAYPDFDSFHKQIYDIEAAGIRHRANHIKMFLSSDPDEQKEVGTELVDSQSELEFSLLRTACIGRTMSSDFFRQNSANNGVSDESLTRFHAERRDIYELKKEPNGFRLIDEQWNLKKFCAGPKNTSIDEYTDEERVSVSRNILYFSNERSKYDLSVKAAPYIANLAFFTGTAFIAFPAAKALLYRIGIQGFKEAGEESAKFVLRSQVKRSLAQKAMAYAASTAKFGVNSIKFIANSFGNAALFTALSVGGAKLNSMTIDSSYLPRFYFNDFEYDKERRDAHILQKIVYNYGEQLFWTTAYFLVMPLADRVVNWGFAKTTGMSARGSSLQAELYSPKFNASRLGGYYRSTRMIGRIVTFGGVMPVAMNLVNVAQGKQSRIAPTSEDWVNGIVFSYVIEGAHLASQSLSRFYRGPSSAEQGSFIPRNRTKSQKYVTRVEKRLQKIESTELRREIIRKEIASAGRLRPTPLLKRMGRLFRKSKPFSESQVDRIIETKTLPQNSGSGSITYCE